MSKLWRMKCLHETHILFIFVVSCVVVAGCDDMLGLPSGECLNAQARARACIAAVQASGVPECDNSLCRAAELCPCDKLAAAKYCFVRSAVMVR